MLFASEPLTQALRQLEVYGHTGLPVISDDGQRLQGWLTSRDVLQALARRVHNAEAAASHPAAAAGHTLPGAVQDARPQHGPDPAITLTYGDRVTLLTRQRDGQHTPRPGGFTAMTSTARNRMPLRASRQSAGWHRATRVT